MSAPATPQPQTLQAAVSTPSPGSWRHPRADEIARRQKANTFDDSNLRKLVWNGGALAALFYTLSHPWTHSLPQTLQPLTTPLILLIALLGLYNIFTALLPLLKTPDELTDIPLTPTQRSLLGLDPNATPPLTPGTQYITPPRYPHSPTPRNISPVMNRNNNNNNTTSNYSTPITQSPSFGREGSSVSSPAAASPLWQKSLGKSTADTARRSSNGSPSPLGSGGYGYGAGAGAGVGGNSSGSIFGTPSPTNARGVGQAGATVALNNKWLYQKGRRASGSRYPSMYSGNTLVDY